MPWLPRHPSIAQTDLLRTSLNVHDTTYKTYLTGILVAAGSNRPDKPLPLIHSCAGSKLPEASAEAKGNTSQKSTPTSHQPIHSTTPRSSKPQHGYHKDCKHRTDLSTPPNNPLRHLRPARPPNLPLRLLPRRHQGKLIQAQGICPLHRWHCC